MPRVRELPRRQTKLIAGNRKVNCAKFPSDFDHRRAQCESWHGDSVVRDAMDAGIFDDHIVWPVGGCTLDEACGRLSCHASLSSHAASSPSASARLFDLLAAGRLVAYGSSHAGEEYLAPERWKPRPRADLIASSVRLSDGCSISRIRVFPVLKAPNRIQLLAQLSFSDVFNRSVVNDPEVTAYAQKAIRVTPQLAKIFVEGFTHRLGLDSHANWPVAYDRWGMLDIRHPDPEKQHVFDSGDPDSIEAVMAGGALRDRYVQLIDLLRSGEMIGYALGDKSGQMGDIPSSIWSHEEFHISIQGDVLQDNRESTNRWDQLKRIWVGLMLRPGTGRQLGQSHLATTSALFHVNTAGIADERSITTAHAPGEQQAAILRVQTTTTAMKECVDWLSEKMQKSPQRRLARKNDLREEAEKRWQGRLSRRAFDKAWDVAIEQTGAFAWKSAGAPRKSPHPQSSR